MPSKRNAKVVRFGKSLAIFLPVDWVRGNGIEKGSVLEIVYDGVVTVKPPKPAL
jgi:hypothetical protein